MIESILGKRWEAADSCRHNLMLMGKPGCSEAIVPALIPFTPKLRLNRQVLFIRCHPCRQNVSQCLKCQFYWLKCQFYWLKCQFAQNVSSPKMSVRMSVSGNVSSQNVSSKMSVRGGLQIRSADSRVDRMSRVPVQYCICAMQVSCCGL
jgi:hypothetical protein